LNRVCGRGEENVLSIDVGFQRGVEVGAIEEKARRFSGVSSGVHNWNESLRGTQLENDDQLMYLFLKYLEADSEANVMAKRPETLVEAMRRA
jgi:hypothetical protein